MGLKTETIDGENLSASLEGVKASYQERSSSTKDKFNEGQREGNRRNVAAVLAGHLTVAHGFDLDQTIRNYDKIHSYLVKKDAEGEV